LAARDHDGTTVPRSITSCSECFAWGMTYAQGVCLACYNFAAPHKGHPTGECAACRRRQRLKQGYCRLCWCQARQNRAQLATDARSKVVLTPYLDGVRWHQLFLSISDRREAPPRIAPRRYGAKGRPLKQAPAPAGRPRNAWTQLVLQAAGPRTYRYVAIDLRNGPPPDNPWLAWALHLAHTTAEARGWRPPVRSGMQRILVMLLAGHHEPDRIRVSDFAAIALQHYVNVDHIVEILTAMDVVVDDRPATLDTWMVNKLADLPSPWQRDLLHWARTLRDGGPRSLARADATVRNYLTAAADAAASWPHRGHLREVVRDDVTAHLDQLQGQRREMTTTALRSLFGWAKRQKLVFQNPTSRIRGPRVPDLIWQQLEPDQITASIAAATTPQARLCMVLAAVHAARPGHIRALQLDDVDLAGRRLTIAGTSRPLDDLTLRVLLDWLRHRHERWPNTANPHLLISKHSALGHEPVSHAAILNFRGLPGTLERLRIDRQLDEAVATGADPLHLAAVFGFSDSTAIRWAANARELIGEPHPTHPLGPR
jgi:integrase